MRSAKRLLALALTAGVGAGAIAAFAVATATASRTAGTPTIKLTQRTVGKILTVNGFTLYRFSHDGSGSKNTCVTMKNACRQTWPALTTVNKPNTGPGVKRSLLGTTRLPSGKKQVTYAGHPLYRYSADTKGSTYYVGFFAFGGYWYAVNANGKNVK
jgi:predicted lipoprotein with Yx(FWY)xxD motif